MNRSRAKGKEDASVHDKGGGVWCAVHRRMDSTNPTTTQLTHSTNGTHSTPYHLISLLSEANHRKPTVVFYTVHKLL